MESIRRIFCLLALWSGFARAVAQDFSVERYEVAITLNDRYE